MSDLRQKANWYKPAPGEPYVPRLAFPTRLKSLNPLWTSCKGDLFVGYDPPRALIPVSAVDPLTTSVSSTTTKLHDDGDPDIVRFPTPAPISRAELDQPKQTAEVSVKPSPGASRPSQPTLRADGNIPEQGSNDGGQAGGTRPEGPDPECFPNGMPLDLFDGPGILIASHADLRNPNGQPPITTIIAQHAATLLPHFMVIGTATLTQDATPVTVSGTVVSLAQSSVVIASKTIPLPKAQQAITTIADRPLIYHPHAVIIAGDMLTPDALPKTLRDGAVVSVNSSDVIVAPKPLSLPQSKLIITKLMGHDFTLLPHAVAISGNTHTSGGSPITLFGMTMTVGLSSLSIESQIIPFNQLYPDSTVLTQKSESDSAHTVSGVTLHESIMFLDSDSNPVDDATAFTSGNPGITLDGTSISVAPDHALVLDLDGTTLTAAGSSGTVAGMPFSMNPDGDLVIGGTTLILEGQPVTVDSIPFSVASDGDLIVDGMTLFPGTASSSDTIAMSLASKGRTTLTPGGQGATWSGISIFMAPDGDLVIAGTSLVSGGAPVTINGTPISAAADGRIVIESSTLRPGSTPGAGNLAASESSTLDGGLDALIASGVSRTDNSSTALALEGRATRASVDVFAILTIVAVSMIMG